MNSWKLSPPMFFSFVIIYLGTSSRSSCTAQTSNLVIFQDSHLSPSWVIASECKPPEPLASLYDCINPVLHSSSNRSAISWREQILCLIHHFLSALWCLTCYEYSVNIGFIRELEPAFPHSDILPSNHVFYLK